MLETILQPTQTSSQVPMVNASEEGAKYPFLRVIKEKDAVLMGINPGNKYQQDLLKLIKTQTTLTNASKGHLFTIHNGVLENLKINLETAISGLNKLIQLQLIFHIAYFEFDPFKKVLRTSQVYITHPSDGTKKTITDIYEEIIRFSYNSIKSWNETRENFVQENFINELKSQYSINQGTYVNDVTSVFNVFNNLKKLNHPTLISNEMVLHFSKELSIRIIKEQLGVSLGSLGLLMLKGQEIIEHFDTAKNFFEETVIAPMKSNTVLRHKLEKVDLEEKSFYVQNPYGIITIKYLAKKALELRTYMLQKFNNDESKAQDYPGSLAVETLLSLEYQVEKFYTDQWKIKCSEMRKEFKKALTNIASNWDSMIVFITPEEVLSFPPEVWNSLTTDKDLLYTIFQHPESTYHIFSSKESHLLLVLVNNLCEISFLEKWKAIAFKNLIEQNEKHLKKIFSDKRFTLYFEKLKKNVYSTYLPWYAKFLVLFPFLSFNNYFFSIAQLEIDKEQTLYAEKNISQTKEFYEKKEQEKREKISALKDDFMEKSIIEVLDLFYFNKRNVPLVYDLKEFYPEIDLKSFLDLLKSKKFKFIPFEEPPVEESNIVLYPEGDTWKKKRIPLIKSLKSMKDDFENAFKFKPDKLSTEKIKKVISFLEKK